MTVDHLLIMRFKPFDHLGSSSQDIDKRLKSFSMAAACFYTVQKKICGHMGIFSSCYILKTNGSSEKLLTVRSSKDLLSVYEIKFESEPPL